MDHRSDLMSAKSKFGNGSECQLRGVGGSTGRAVGDANEGGRSRQPWPHQAATSAITSGSSYSGSSYSIYTRSRSGSSTSAAPPVTGCGNSRSRQVAASAKVMHAAAASKTTSWRTPATSRYVLPAFSFIDN